MTNLELKITSDSYINFRALVCSDKSQLNHFWLNDFTSRQVDKDNTQEQLTLPPLQSFGEEARATLPNQALEQGPDRQPGRNLGSNSN